MSGQLKIKVDRKPAVVITRSALKAHKLVYVVTANRDRKYPWGRSKIVYIGTTQAGARRVAHSAASKARIMLRKRGVRQLELHIVTCKRRPNVESWKKLERALLISFKKRFGKVPCCNKTGHRMDWRDEREYFRPDKLEQVIEQLS
jgi:hypothetical protein